MDPLGLEEIVDGLVLEDVAAKFERFPKPRPLALYSDKTLSRALLLVFKVTSNLPYLGVDEQYRVYQFFGAAKASVFDVVSQTPEMPVALVAKTFNSVVVTYWSGYDDNFRLMLPEYQPKEYMDDQTGVMEWDIPSTHKRLCNTYSVEKGLDILLKCIQAEAISSQVELLYVSAALLPEIVRDLSLANGFGQYVKKQR